MTTNSAALIVPAQPPAGQRRGAAPVFQEAPKPLIYIPNGWAWVIWALAILALLAAIYFGLALVAKEKPALCRRRFRPMSAPGASWNRPWR